MNRAARAEQAAAAALEELGYEPVRHTSAHDEGFDLLARKAKRVFLVQVKALSPLRWGELRGIAADTYLRLRGEATKRRATMILAVVLDRPSPRAADELEHYVDRYASELAWIMLSTDGWRRWHIGDDVGDSGGAVLRRTRGAPREASGDPFSPGFQWLYKVLLLPGIDPGLWGGVDSRPGSVTELARAAGVSQGYASVFVTAAEQRGHLRRAANGFAFPDPRRLLEEWSTAASLRPGKLVPVRLVHPVPFDAAEIERLARRLVKRADPTAYAVGFHYACKLLGLSRSNVATPRLYVAGNVQGLLAQVGLAPCPAAEAAFDVVVPRAERSVLAGAVRKDGLPVTDILQTYLDLRQSPVRGLEEAEHVFDSGLVPHFQRAGWL